MQHTKSFCTRTSRPILKRDIALYSDCNFTYIENKNFKKICRPLFHYELFWDSEYDERFTKIFPKMHSKKIRVKTDTFGVKVRTDTSIVSYSNK